MFKDRLMKFLKLDGLIDTLSEYFDTRVQLLKLEIREDVLRTLSKICVGLLIAIAFIFFLFLISVAGAHAIGQRLGATAGFSIVAGIYLLVAVLFFLFRKDISMKLEKFLTEITQKKDN